MKRRTLCSFWAKEPIAGQEAKEFFGKSKVEKSSDVVSACFGGEALD